jgi:hypothetical protein
MYKKPRSEETLDWEWASGQLSSALIYWLVSTRPDGAPHPRPVHGIWTGDKLLLSNGSWKHHDNYTANPRVNVHLESGTSVVIVEGRFEGYDADGLKSFLAEYNPKYGLQFDDLLPPSIIKPEVVLAWDTLNDAGTGGFRAVGKWTFLDGS